jgi:hypothetical protein
VSPGLRSLPKAETDDHNLCSRTIPSENIQSQPPRSHWTTIRFLARRVNVEKRLRFEVREWDVRNSHYSIQHDFVNREACSKTTQNYLGLYSLLGGGERVGILLRLRGYVKKFLVIHNAQIAVLLAAFFHTLLLVTVLVLRESDAP